MTLRRTANQNRAQRALHALNAYLMVSDHDDEPEIYCDLFTDLGHLCDSEGLDFQQLLNMALIHWSCERASPTTTTHPQHRRRS